MKIGLCGNVELSQLADLIDTLLPPCDIITGKPGLYREEIDAPFGEFKLIDICILVLDWRRLSPEIYRFGYGDDAAHARECFRSACDELKKVISNFRKNCTSTILLFTPIPERRTPLGFIERLQPYSPGQLFAECQRIFDSLCSSFTDLYPVDVELIASAIGTNQVYDHMVRFESLQPFTQTMLQATAEHIAAICFQLNKYPLKCIVLDLDNTLWGGVIGEDGYENILLGDEGIGAAFKEFQIEVLKLHKQGIILAICSKNNTCDALEVLDRHPHMLIRPDTISCYRINWEEKSKGIAEIAQELNIGLNSIMFIDDNPAERELVHTILPDVEILDLPSSPAMYAETLKRCTRFWPLQITEDDFRKHEYIAGNRKRQNALDHSQYKEDFLRQSDIEITIGTADDATLPRITQLFNKTNQFNLTTKRYDQSRLESLAATDGNYLFWMSLRDKYGDYGLIATALIIQNCIDSFILSCRAYGKNVESSFLIHVLNLMKSKGLHVVYGDFFPSGRNTPAKDFYRNEGFVPEFEKRTGISRWKCDLQTMTNSIPAWITVRLVQPANDTN